MIDTRPFSAVLLDIEGTTTSISFVYEVLFPYIREHVAAFVTSHWDALLDERALYTAEGTDASSPAALATAVLSQMDTDQKTTALKTLQGRIWKAGYVDGTLRADVFDDVPGALQSWKRAGNTICIYSSGSIAAQKLLFGHTHYGDLCPLISGYFDTTTGPKREAPSYTAIADAMGVAPEQILFATDVVAEADAAVAAGMQAVIMDRPGNKEQPAHTHPVLSNFSSMASAE